MEKYYKEFTDNFTSQFGFNANLMIVHGDDFENIETYCAFEIQSMLQESKTSNLYDLIKSIDEDNKCLVYAFTWQRGKHNIPLVKTLGVLNKDGRTWEKVGE